MKESGDLEQDADIVIGVYRSDLKEPATEMGILKGRDLGTGKINLYFDRHIQKFSDRSTNGQ
jgi:replicative DNA helicase